MPDNQGQFRFSKNAGNYRLQIRLLGYQSINLPVDLKQHTDLGNLSMEPNSKQLGVVEVVGAKL